MSFRPLVAACSAALLLAGAARAEGVLIGRVSRVHDGDTVTLRQGEHAVMVRLSGIDAPEADQPFGAESRAALRDCAFGRNVVVNVHGTDRHGRSVGTLDSTGRDCGLLLLKAGLAWHYKAYRHEQPLAERAAYADAERVARQRRLGLWAQKAPEAPWDHRREQPQRDPAMR